MRTLLVDYDLNAPGKDYSTLLAKLRNYPNWCRFLKSSWLIRTDRTPVQLRAELLPFIDVNDDLLVMDVTGDAAAWYGLDEQISTWLSQNL